MSEFSTFSKEFNKRINEEDEPVPTQPIIQSQDYERNGAHGK